MARTNLTLDQVGYPYNYQNNVTKKAKLDEHDVALDRLGMPPGTTANAFAQVRSVRAVQTSNVTLAAAQSTTLDGLTLVAGDRVLCVGQSTGSQNGVYVVGTVGGGTAAWTRAVDMPAGAILYGEQLFCVDAGTAGANKVYKTTVAGAITVGTTAITFELFVKSPSGTVDQTCVAKGAAANTLGFPRLSFVITVADGSTVLTGQTLDATYGKFVVTDVHVIKTGSTGGTTDAVQLCTDSGGSTAVTSSFALNTIAAGGVVRTTSIANNTFAAGSVFYVKRTHTTDCGCSMHISGYASA